MPIFLRRRSLTACGLALPCEALHDLADEPAEQARLLLGLRRLVRIGVDDLRDHGLDGAEVGDLLHAARLDDLLRISALRPDDLEEILGDLAGNVPGLDEVDNAAELSGRNRGSW